MLGVIFFSSKIFICSLLGSRRLLLDVLLDLLHDLRDSGLLGLALGLLLLHLLPEARGTPALDLCAITTKVYVE